MRRLWRAVTSLTVVLLLLALAPPAMAQDGPSGQEDLELMLFTAYPSQVIGFDESPEIDLTVRGGAQPEIVSLEMDEIPEGWTATFWGRNTLVKSVFVEPGKDVSIELRLEPADDVAGGVYRFVVLGRGQSGSVRLPLELTVEERVPARLIFDTDLPTARGGPSSTFRYTAQLKNEGDEDLTVNLVADAPAGFEVTIQTGGTEVTSLPLEANANKSLSIQAKPFLDLPAGSYPLTIHAEGGGTRASLSLTAEITGEANLSVTTPDERLSAEAYAGQETPLKVIVRNTGSAPARRVKMSASQPSGWSVTFEPEEIGEVPAGEQVEVTAKLRPAEKALAGDYMVTVRAQPEGSSNKTAELRITVLTSTLWGIVGVGLIAVAVGVVGLAVFRFGRR